MDYIRLYLAFAKVAFLTQLEYRGQYFVRILSKIIAWSTGFIMIMVLLNKFKTIGDWTTYEVLFLYALDVLSYSIAGTFFMGSFGELPALIQYGEFDSILTKPINPLLYLLCTKVSAGYTSNYVISITILFLCFQKLNITLSFVKLFWLIIVILGASLIQATGFMITAIPSFWIVKNEGMRGLFYTNLTQFLQYPLTIYSKGIQIVLTFILPYAFINYYPAQFFLGKGDSVFNPVFQYMTPFVGALLFWLSYQFWRLGLDSYQSSGS